MPRPYAPSGNAGRGGLVLLAGASIGAGFALGLLEGFVSQLVYVVILFPMVVGAAIGGAAQWAVDIGKIRRPGAVVLFAILAGVVAQSTMRVVAYGHARARIAERLQSDQETQAYVAEHGVSESVDAAFRGEQHVLPFLGYLRVVAKNGITVTSIGESTKGRGPTLTGGWVYFLWLAELFLVAAIAAMGPHRKATAPFCESCNAWYDDAKELIVGAGDRNTLAETCQRFEFGQYAEAMRALGVSNGKTAAVVSVLSCPKACSSHEPVLELKVVAEKRQDTVVYRSLIAPSALRTMRAAAQAAG